jgi:hypothetical protein
MTPARRGNSFFAMLFITDDLNEQMVIFMKKVLSLLLISAGLISGISVDSTLNKFNNSAYAFGREYYVLRSGRTQMFLQSDKADFGSAFTYLLFDSQNARQSVRKDSASNYSPGSGFQSSALQIVLGKFPFTALGHNTLARWVEENGIPSVEAVWWAGGIEVTEKITALTGKNKFRRNITLRGSNLVGEERIKIRLGLPEGEIEKKGNSIFFSNHKCRIAVTIATQGLNLEFNNNFLEAEGVTIAQGEEKTIETFIDVQIPSGDENQFLLQVNTGREDLLESSLLKWRNSNNVSTKDTVVRNLFNNSRFTLPGYISDIGIMDAGVFEYGGQWIRDASNTALGLLQIGEFELTRSLLAYMLDNMITKDGITMISNSYEKPENEEFDQMGELWHVMKNYYYWTGDVSLLKQNASKLIAMTERPLLPVFRDSTGMVHNSREYWERFFTDAYELAYQIWVIEGLHDAVELAPIIGAGRYTDRWKEVSEKMINSLLHHPKMALVNDGKLIKRRDLNGNIVDVLKYSGYIIDSPGATESIHRLLPDAEMALPIAMRIVDPKSSLAKNTLKELEKLWNARWEFGGYDRYHTSSQPDQPGPWSFATCFILRAQHEAGLYQNSRRTLEWLANVQGGHSGAYFEEIPINRGQEFTCGILPWPSGEIALFVVRHWLGVNFVNNRMIIKPNLYPGTGSVTAALRYKNSRVKIEIDGSGPLKNALINGVRVKLSKDGSLMLPENFNGGTVSLKTK